MKKRLLLSIFIIICIVNGKAQPNTKFGIIKIPYHLFFLKQSKNEFNSMICIIYSIITNSFIF